MSFALVATNPCHLFDLAVALAEAGEDVHFYSGYPRWRLAKLVPGGRWPARLRLTTASARTLVTYFWRRWPERLRPPDRALFRWQDRGFDRAIARRLRPARFVHGLPGQCRATFGRALALGAIPVLNHASGPVAAQHALVLPEYQRAGLPPPRPPATDAALAADLAAEWQMARYHAVASQVVARQLEAAGVPKGDLFVVPYGAAAHRFPKQAAPVPGPLRIAFAGALSLRKGLHYLLRALEMAQRPDWRLDVFGQPMAETAPDRAAYRGATPVVYHGAIGQADLGRALGRSHVLVLPSLEEAFGLVVVQALQVGTPVIVSDRVGAAGLLREESYGRVVPPADPAALASALLHVSQHPHRVQATFDWGSPAAQFVAAHRLLRCASL